MNPPAGTPPLSPLATTTWEVGAHAVRITRIREGRWGVAVDGTTAPDTYPTQAEAWEAGVREAARLDRLAGA